MATDQHAVKMTKWIYCTPDTLFSNQVNNRINGGIQVKKTCAPQPQDITLVGKNNRKRSVSTANPVAR